MSESKRKKIFNNEWTKDFYFIEKFEECICLLCQKPLQTFKKSNLETHYKSHVGKRYETTLKDDDRDKKIEELKAKYFKSINWFVKSDFVYTREENDNKFLFLVSKKLTEYGKPYSDVDLIREILEGFCQWIAPEYSQRVKTYSLKRKSHTTRVEKLGKEQTAHLFEDLQNNCKYFSLCLDESLDVCDLPQVLYYIRYSDDNFNIKTKYLTIDSLKGYTKADDYFDSFKRVYTKFKLSMSKCVSICTDGARALTGCKNGLCVKLVKFDNCNENILFLHCLIHQQQLSAKVINSSIFVKEVIDITNFIHRSELSHRTFRESFNEGIEFGRHTSINKMVVNLHNF